MSDQVRVGGYAWDLERGEVGLVTHIEGGEVHLLSVRRADGWVGLMLRPATQSEIVAAKSAARNRAGRL